MGSFASVLVRCLNLETKNCKIKFSPSGNCFHFEVVFLKNAEKLESVLQSKAGPRSLLASRLNGFTHSQNVCVFETSDYIVDGKRW